MSTQPKFFMKLGGRRIGKTTALAKEIRDNPKAVVVVMNAQMADHYMRHHGIRPEQIILPSHTERLRGRRVELYIDDLDAYINHIVGPLPLKGFTMSIPGWTVEDELVVDDDAVEWARDLGWEGA
jgi:hypothetical protein